MDGFFGGGGGGIPKWVLPCLLLVTTVRVLLQHYSTVLRHLHYSTLFATVLQEVWLRGEELCCPNKLLTGAYGTLPYSFLTRGTQSTEQHSTVPGTVQ